MLKTFLTFPSVKHAVALKGSIFLATDESHNIRVFNVNTGTLQYVLRVPLVHGDTTLQLDVRLWICAVFSFLFSGIFLLGVSVSEQPRTRLVYSHLSATVDPFVRTTLRANNNTSDSARDYASSCLSMALAH